MYDTLTQSEEEISLDDQLIIEFMRIKGQRGGRPPKSFKFDHKKRMKRMIGRSLISPYAKDPNDELCLARSIVSGVSYLNQEDPTFQWESVRKGDRGRRTAQKKRAQKLMKDAGLENHKGFCGEEELTKLQRVLEGEYQIILFSSSAGNSVTFKGETECERKLYLYLDEEHYLFCAKPHKAIYNTAYSCDHCLRGYDHADLHKCKPGIKCPCCFAIKLCPFEQWKECIDCNRFFRSSSCYNSHKENATTEENTNKRRKKVSWCEKYRKCIVCHKLYITDNKAFTKKR